MEPPSVGSVTDEHGHSRPVSSLTDPTHSTVTLRNVLGRLHAVSSQRTVHHGGAGLELPILYRRSRVYHLRPHPLAADAQTQPHTNNGGRIYLHHRLVLHHLDLHAHEAARIFARIIVKNQVSFMYSSWSLRTLFRHFELKDLSKEASP